MTAAAHADAGTVEGVLAAALTYTARGWRVFPCWWPLPDGRCACGKPQCDDIGKHPLGEAVPHGRNDSTTDADTIRAWWRRWPRANIAIATGPESGLVVLDQDPAHDGDESLMQLEQDHGAIPDTAVSITGGGGTHSLFAHPRDRKVVSKVGLPGYPGLDTRADGGYIIAPPSLHRSGRLYCWNVILHPDDVALAACPEWLIDLAGASAKPNGAGANGFTDPSRIPEGKRDKTLTSMAGTMRRRGMPPEAIEAALLVTNAQRCDPPLPEAQVRKIAASVGRYAPGPEPQERPSHANGSDPDGATRERRPLELASVGFTGASLRALRDRPEAVSPLPGLLDPEPALHVLNGKSKTGKSTFALALARAWSLGVHPWPGAPQLPGTRALVISHEQTATRIDSTLRRLSVFADAGAHDAGPSHLTRRCSMEPTCKPFPRRWRRATCCRSRSTLPAIRSPPPCAGPATSPWDSRGEGSSVFHGISTTDSRHTFRIKSRPNRPRIGAFLASTGAPSTGGS